MDWLVLRGSSRPGKSVQGDRIEQSSSTDNPIRDSDSGMSAAPRTKCMFLSIGRRAKLGRELKRLKLNVLGEVCKFITDVSEAHGTAPQRSVKSTALASGALSFFLYALDRGGRSSCGDTAMDTVLSEIMSDTSLADLVEIRDPGRGHSEAGDLRARFERMNFHLAEASSLLGTRLDDRSSALWLAAVRISTESDPRDENLLVYTVQSRLLVGLIRLNLTKRLEAIVALMR
jgi:hypothetical protein